MEEESKPVGHDLGGNTADAIPAGQIADPPAVAGESPADKDPGAHQDHPPDSPRPDDRAPAVQADMERIERELETIAASSGKMAAELREMHRLYHNEFAGRLKSMQEELDRYHDVEKGRTFDGLLAEIARMYSDNVSIVKEITDEKLNRKVRYLFMDILQNILEANGVSRLKSKPGDRRNTRHCQVVHTFSTDDPAQHDTVKASHNIGFHIENRTLVKERVDIYRYTGTNAGSPAENKEDH